MVLGNLCTLSNVRNITLIQSASSSGDVTIWYLDQIHLPIFNTLHFTLSVGGEEVTCNLTQVVFDTPGGT